jgi:hypothetical protein
MIKLVLISIFFLLVLQYVEAAEVKYFIYHVSYQVKLKTNSKEENAKRGMFISNSNQSLILTTLAEVMLVQNDGKSMLLNKPGTYTYVQIKALFNKMKPNNVTSAFFAYVFEKFIGGDTDDEKQKVSASVYRGKTAMLNPVDSSFSLSFPVTLKWIPEQKNIPYKISYSFKNQVCDTVIRGKLFLTIPEAFFKYKKAGLLMWSAVPSDSKQPSPAAFICIIPLKSDVEIIQKQLKQMKLIYSKKTGVLRLMERDLFERWLEIYQLN